MNTLRLSRILAAHLGRAKSTVNTPTRMRDLRYETLKETRTVKKIAEECVTNRDEGEEG